MGNHLDTPIVGASWLGCKTYLMIGGFIGLCYVLDVERCLAHEIVGSDIVMVPHLKGNALAVDAFVHLENTFLVP